MTRTAYDVLGVAQGATDAEIRRAYHARAREVHPDRGGTAERMLEANAAFELVRTAEARAAYAAHLARRAPPIPEVVARAHRYIDHAATFATETVRLATLLEQAKRELFG